MKDELALIEGMTVFNTETNFLLFTIGEDSINLFNYLSQNEIAIRNVGVHPVLKDCLRVTISKKEDNSIFIRKVNEYMENR